MEPPMQPQTPHTIIKELRREQEEDLSFKSWQQIIDIPFRHPGSKKSLTISLHWQRLFQWSTWPHVLLINYSNK